MAFDPTSGNRDLRHIPQNQWKAHPGGYYFKRHDASFGDVQWIRPNVLDYIIETGLLNVSFGGSDIKTWAYDHIAFARVYPNEHALFMKSRDMLPEIRNYLQFIRRIGEPVDLGEPL